MNGYKRGVGRVGRDVVGGALREREMVGAEERETSWTDNFDF